MSADNPINVLPQTTNTGDSPSNKPEAIAGSLPDTCAQHDSKANSENDPSQAIDVPKAPSSSSRSSSFHPKSATSTFTYGQIPFDEFRPQVEELCHLLWSPSPKEPQGGSTNRLLSMLRSKKLNRSQGPRPPPKKFLIERMTGGSYNRVIGITIISADGKDPIQVVLRLPRHIPDANLERDIAILQYVRQHSTIPVPEVQAFDFTSNNPVNSPYVIQNRIPGITLQDAANNGMSHEQWCIAAKEVAHIILELQSIKHPHPGIITPSTGDNGVQSFTVEPFDVKSPVDPEGGQMQAQYGSRSTVLQNYELNTLRFFATQFGRWRARELQVDPTSILYLDHMHRLTDMVSAMYRLGCLGDDTNCLSHGDLAARNIMVQIGSNNALTITGVLDWDRAAFTPTFVSCAPPWWLWQDEIFGDVDALEDETNADEEPPDPELVEVKRIFEETVGDDYCCQAYMRHYPMARRLWWIAMHGNYSDSSFQLINTVLSEWAAYKNELDDLMANDDGEPAHSAT